MLRKFILVLLMKRGCGENVDLCNVKDRKVLDVIHFLHWFGERHTFIWYYGTESSAGRGRVRRKKVQFGMFPWAVRCGVKSKVALCMGAPISGSVIY
jgi:hypothetical protein